MGGRDLRKAKLGGQLCQLLLMHRIQIGMQQRDCDGVDPRRTGRLHIGARAGQIQGCQNCTGRIKALGHLDNAVIKQLWARNLHGKQIGAGLISDFKQISKTLSDHQKHSCALTFQQSIGGHSCAHLHRGNIGLFQLCIGEYVTYSSDGGINVLLWVFRQKLVTVKHASRILRHDIRERASAIDPKFPCHCLLLLSVLHKGRKRPSGQEEDP